MKNGNSIKNLKILKNVELNNILISNQISSAKINYRDFIGYMNDNYEIKSLRIMPSKMSAYVKNCDAETK